MRLTCKCEFEKLNLRKTNSIRTMKTKSLIITALLTAAGSMGLMAQSTNVYSLNVVGYVNVTVPHGFSIIANPLNGATNTLANLISAPPVNTVVYEYVNGNYQIATYAQDDFGNNNWDNNLTFAPGTGAWIYNPAVTNFTVTFVGQIQAGGYTNAVPTGFSLKSSVVPQSGQLDTALSYTPGNNDVVYLFRNGNYQISTYAQDDFGNLNWDTPPVPNVGEGFWIYNANAAKNWVQSFSVN